MRRACKYRQQELRHMFEIILRYTNCLLWVNRSYFR